MQRHQKEQTAELLCKHLELLAHENDRPKNVPEILFVQFLTLDAVLVFGGVGVQMGDGSKCFVQFQALPLRILSFLSWLDSRFQLLFFVPNSFLGDLSSFA